VEEVRKTEMGGSNCSWERFWREYIHLFQTAREWAQEKKVEREGDSENLLRKEALSLKVEFERNEWKKDPRVKSWGLIINSIKGGRSCVFRLLFGRDESFDKDLG
jgi:hypothetical protein